MTTVQRWIRWQVEFILQWTFFLHSRSSRVPFDGERSPHGACVFEVANVPQTHIQTSVEALVIHAVHFTHKMYTEHQRQRDVERASVVTSAVDALRDTTTGADRALSLVQWNGCRLTSQRKNSARNSIGTRRWKSGMIEIYLLALR